MSHTLVAGVEDGAAAALRFVGVFGATASLDLVAGLWLAIEIQAETRLMLAIVMICGDVKSVFRQGSRGAFIYLEDSEDIDAVRK